MGKEISRSNTLLVAPVSNYGAIAREKVKAPFADKLWHRNERVEAAESVTVKLNGVNETLYLVRTSSENALGARKNGRLVLSFTPDLDQQIGGLFFFEEAGEKQMQSLYLDPDLRGQGLMSMLARAARQFGITAAAGPFSEAGAQTVRRYGFVKSTR